MVIAGWSDRKSGGCGNLWNHVMMMNGRGNWRLSLDYIGINWLAGGIFIMRGCKKHLVGIVTQLYFLKSRYFVLKCR